jgi:hypothetical protein
MAKVKISFDFSRHNYPDKVLNVKSTTIAENLTDNPVYTTLADKVAILVTKNNLFGGLLAKIENGNKQMTAEKNQARVDLEDILRSIALNVQDISQGDEIKILSSGFDVNRKATPIGVLEQVVNVQVNQSKITGCIEVSWDVLSNAKSYIVRYTKYPKTDESTYVTATSTKHKLLIENLELGAKFIIQVAGVGADPQRVWSIEVVSCFVS